MSYVPKPQKPRCDICIQPTERGRRVRIPANPMRRIAGNGFDPGEIGGSLVAKAGEKGETALLAAKVAWRDGLVAKSRTHWILCASCEQKTRRYRKKWWQFWIRR